MCKLLLVEASKRYEKQNQSGGEEPRFLPLVLCYLSSFYTFVWSGYKCICAVYMNGSRTNFNVSKDIFQDYDIIYAVPEKEDDNDLFKYFYISKWRYGIQLFYWYKKNML